MLVANKQLKSSLKGMLKSSLKACKIFINKWEKSLWKNYLIFEDTTAYEAKCVIKWRPRKPQGRKLKENQLALSSHQKQTRTTIDVHHS